jgi:hypothetical protein
VEPAPPALVAQDASAQGAADIAETALWRYHLRYWHEHMAQDEVFVTVSLNLLPASDESVIATDCAPPRADYRLSARLLYSDDGERIEALLLTRETDEPVSATSWPHADYQPSSGLSVELDNGAGDGLVRLYAFEPAVPSEGERVIGLTWGGLNVTAAQNACAALAVVRNRGLGTGDASEDDLVYRTATVYASSVVTPANRWPQDMDISHLGDTVDAALAALFAALFRDRQIGQRVMMELHYGYLLLPQAELDTAPRVYVPVGLYPSLSITLETAAQIAWTLSTWKDTHKPVATGGEWLFSLALLSQIDPHARQPLLNLARLVYRLR